MRRLRLSALNFWQLVFSLTSKWDWLLVPAAIGIVFWLLSCDSKPPKFQQYFVEGEQLYLKRCSNCHQKDGKGLGLVYPPLSPSDFMDQNLEEVICMIKKGRKGEIMVNGSMYNQPMPGVPSLTELEIAEIATYIYNTWGHEKGLVEVSAVRNALQRCANQ